MPEIISSATSAADHEASIETNIIEVVSEAAGTAVYHHKTDLEEAEISQLEEEK